MFSASMIKKLKASKKRKIQQQVPTSQKVHEILVTKPTTSKKKQKTKPTTAKKKQKEKSKPKVQRLRDVSSYVKIIRSKRKILVLLGPTGCGKSFLGESIAEELNRDVVYHSASKEEDVRTLLRSTSTKKLFARKSFIVFRIDSSPLLSILKLLSEPGYFLIEMTGYDNRYMAINKHKKKIEYVTKFTDAQIKLLLLEDQKKNGIIDPLLAKRAMDECNGNNHVAIQIARMDSEVVQSHDYGFIIDTLLMRNRVYSFNDRKREQSKLESRRQLMMDNMDDTYAKQRKLAQEVSNYENAT